MRLPALPSADLFSKWQSWAEEVRSIFERGLDVQPVELPAFSSAKLPAASRAKWHLIIVTDDALGAVPAFSDGTYWRRVTDRGVVIRPQALAESGNITAGESIVVQVV